MADEGLRKRLAAAAYLALDSDMLDEVYKRINLGENMKIPITIKYTFSKDDDGTLTVETAARTSLPMTTVKLVLKDDGQQMTLFEPAEAAPPEPKTKKKKKAPVEATAEGGQAARLAAILAENTHLYKTGQITKEQAESVGVLFEAAPPM